MIDPQFSIPYNSPAPFPPQRCLAHVRSSFKPDPTGRAAFYVPPFAGRGIGKDGDMSRLFEVTQINGMELTNRFVRYATYKVLAAEDGRCSPRLVANMNQLADGGVGLIITSHAYVRSDGQGGPRQIGDGWARC